MGLLMGMVTWAVKSKRCTTAWNAQHKRYMHEDPARLKKHAGREMGRKAHGQGQTQDSIQTKDH